MVLLFSLSSLYANKNHQISDNDFIKKLMELQKKKKQAKSDLAKAKKRTKNLNRLEKSIDELSNKLGVNSK
jgi:t-SNARE complex subunit (syntaxin)